MDCIKSSNWRTLIKVDTLTRFFWNNYKVTQEIDIFISKKSESASAFVDIDRNQYEQFILIKIMWDTLYINVSSIYTLLVWVSVCLYPINVKTSEPRESKTFEATYTTPGKVYGCIQVEKVCPKKCPIFFIFKIHLFKQKNVKICKLVKTWRLGEFNARNQ